MIGRVATMSWGIRYTVNLCSKPALSRYPCRWLQIDVTSTISSCQPLFVNWLKRFISTIKRKPATVSVHWVWIITGFFSKHIQFHMQIIVRPRTWYTSHGYLSDIIIQKSTSQIKVPVDLPLRHAGGDIIKSLDKLIREYELGTYTSRHATINF